MPTGEAVTTKPTHVLRCQIDIDVFISLSPGAETGTASADVAEKLLDLDEKLGGLFDGIEAYTASSINGMSSTLETL